jgi:hypothetical protein
MESTILGGRIKTALPIYISPAVRLYLANPCALFNDQGLTPCFLFAVGHG